LQAVVMIIKPVSIVKEILNFMVAFLIVKSLL